MPLAHPLSSFQKHLRKLQEVIKRFSHHPQFENLIRPFKYPVWTEVNKHPCDGVWRFAFSERGGEFVSAPAIDLHHVVHHPPRPCGCKYFCRRGGKARVLAAIEKRSGIVGNPLHRTS